MAFCLVEVGGRVAVADVIERQDMKDGHSKVRLLVDRGAHAVDPWGRRLGDPVAEFDRIVPTGHIHENDQAVILL